MNIAVGISGGIDSTMAALLLKEQGHNVIGITMAIWDESIPITESIKSGCFGPGEKEDIESARRVCGKLGIEHHVIHLKDEFKDNVLSYFCDTYISGKTPNPCLMCNQRMKFGLLPQKAREQGLEFDLFATGHYVRVRSNPETGRYQLLRAIDKAKDQSYFLTYLSQKQLASCTFPLGEITKVETKSIAMKYGFEELIAKQESQDFLETDDYSVLFEGGSFAPGDIVDINGQTLATHRGLIHYTIGQRRNLGIPGQSEPYFVLEIDAAQNRIIAGPKQFLFKRELVVERMNWISIAEPTGMMRTTAKIRLQHEPANCMIEIKEDHTVKVTFDEDQLSITPGQAVVFYDNDIVLGGGVISGA